MAVAYRTDHGRAAAVAKGHGGASLHNTRVIVGALIIPCAQALLLDIGLKP